MCCVAERVPTDEVTTLHFVAFSAEAVQTGLDAVSEFEMRVTHVHADEHGVSVDLEVSDYEVLPVLTTLAGACARGDGARVSLNGHSPFSHPYLA